MTISRQQQYINKFRYALREATLSGNETSVTSILASANGMEFLRPVIRDELAPVAGELEFHLRGQGIEGHSANAEAFSELVRRIAASTKYFVKETKKAKKQESGLLVDVGAGSVRVTFKAPSSQVPNATQLTIEQDLEILPIEDRYSEALRNISVVLSASDPDAPESEALLAAIEKLPAASRHELACALEPIRKQGWSIDGSFSQRGIGSEEIRIERRNAEYLKDQLKVEKVETETWLSTGRLDGHRWSSGIAYFAPDGQNHVMPATFASAKLQSQAAKIATEEDNKVQATFTVYIKRSMTSSTAKKSYELTAIRKL